MSDTCLALHVNDHHEAPVLQRDGELDLATECVFMGACADLPAHDVVLTGDSD
ncbi:hypothetical protein EDD27_6515 [Nonomuraea polychroma]|uniref:Uncharacterized protein n=1 Tax=Nonomuraea polychroma TaxID=46176 RepID=A0A438MDF0_9ACTN|nr:hypothetical protein [Nonomuraea polychroma]RVX43813.1 hypothetical protein EDD27_6515 [Nonomuraea polychroma]